MTQPNTEITVALQTDKYTKDQAGHLLDSFGMALHMICDHGAPTAYIPCPTGIDQPDLCVVALADGVSVADVQARLSGLAPIPQAQVETLAKAHMTVDDYNGLIADMTELLRAMLMGEAHSDLCTVAQENVKAPKFLVFCVKDEDDERAMGLMLEAHERRHGIDQQPATIGDLKALGEALAEQYHGRDNALRNLYSMIRNNVMASALVFNSLSRVATDLREQLKPVSRIAIEKALQQAKPLLQQLNDCIEHAEAYASGKTAREYEGKAADAPNPYPAGEELHPETEAFLNSLRGEEGAVMEGAVDNAINNELEAAIEQAKSIDDTIQPTPEATEAAQEAGLEAWVPQPLKVQE